MRCVTQRDSKQPLRNEADVDVAKGVSTKDTGCDLVARVRLSPLFETRRGFKFGSWANALAFHAVLHLVPPDPPLGSTRSVNSTLEDGISLA